MKPWMVKKEDWRKKEKPKQKKKVYAKITLSFDEEMGAQISTVVPKEYIDVLIKEGVLDPKFKDDETAIRLAMVALADDLIGTIVEDVNGITR